MAFYAVLDEVLQLLQRHKRVSSRALKRRCGFDDADLAGRGGWRTAVAPAHLPQRSIVVASHPEFDGVLGTAETPETALTAWRVARRSMIETLLAAGDQIPESPVAPSGVASS